MFKTVVLVAIAASCCASCGGPAYIRLQPPADYQFDPSNPRSIVFYTTSVSGECIPGGTVNIGMGQAGKSGYGAIAQNPFAKSDYADHYAIYHSQVMAPGRYSFRNIGIITSPFDSWTIPRFDAPFELLPGKATYLGRLDVEFLCTDTYHETKVRLVVHDDSRYDLVTFQKRTSQINRADIIVRLLEMPGFEKQ